MNGIYTIKINNEVKNFESLNEVFAYTKKLDGACYFDNNLIGYEVYLNGEKIYKQKF